MRKRVDPGGVHRESDGFWSKVLVATIVVIWVSLVAGQWAGKWAIEHGKFAPKDASAAHRESAMEQRPAYVPAVPPTAPRPAVVTSQPVPPSPPVASVRPPASTVTVAPVAPVASPSAVPSASVVVVAPTPTPVIPPSPSASPSGPPRAYALQMGVFTNRVNAEKMADDLRSKGYSIELVPEASGSDSNWVVRLGHFPDKAAAGVEQDKLEAQGYHGLAVPR